ncbi:hypothetical protein F4808DRAFT_320798 [Astrocystis sublimbata]|nr:hypothetical protein F4808DRAFT_320798 [Astrocystis sublimbata]
MPPMLVLGTWTAQYLSRLTAGSLFPLLRLIWTSVASARQSSSVFASYNTTSRAVPVPNCRVQLIKLVFRGAYADRYALQSPGGQKPCQEFDRAHGRSHDCDSLLD